MHDTQHCPCPQGVANESRTWATYLNIFLAFVAIVVVGKILQTILSAIASAAESVGRAASRIDWDSVIAGGVIVSGTVLLLLILPGLNLSAARNPFAVLGRLRVRIFERIIRKHIAERPELSEVTYADMLVEMYEHHPRPNVSRELLQDYKTALERAQSKEQ